MKRLKIISLLISVVLASAYLSFLVILPNVVNLNKYKGNFQAKALAFTGLNIDYTSAKLITTPTLKIGIKANDFSVSYPNNQKFFESKKIALKVRILPLIIKTISISNIDVDSPALNCTILKNNKLDLEEFIEQNKDLSFDKKREDVNYNFSERIPDIQLNNYNLAIKDSTSNDNLAFKGKSLKIDKAKLNKHIHVVTDGELAYDNNKNVSYKFDIDSFLPEVSQTEKEHNSAFLSKNIVQIYKKYDFKANIKSKIKIKEKNGRIQNNGYIDATGVSLNIDGAKLPAGYLNINFKKDKVKLNSNIYFSKSEKAAIAGKFAYGKNKKFELEIKAPNVNITHIYSYSLGLLDCLNLKNDLENVNAQGMLSANIKFATDLKKIKSQGNCGIRNAQVTHKTIPVGIKGINAYVDLSDNGVNIKQAEAIIDKTPLKISGYIYPDSSTNININTKHLYLPNLINAFAPTDFKQVYKFLNGYLTLDATIKGKLSDTKPELKLNLTSLLLNDKANGLVLSNGSTIANISTTKKAYKGYIKTVSTKIYKPNLKLAVKNDNTQISIDKDNIKILPTYLYLNSSPIKLEGETKDYMDKKKTKISVIGGIKTDDLVQALPLALQPSAVHQGTLPIIIDISGNNKKTNISAQLLSNASNHLSLIRINKLINQTSIIDFSADIVDSDLHLKDFGIYQLQAHKPLSANLKNNLTNSYKLAQISGKITNIDKKTPYINNLDIQIPASLAISSNAFGNSKLNAKGDVDISGYTSEPIIQGNLNISNVVIPEFMTKVQNIELAINNSILNAKVDNFIVNGSQLSVDANAIMDFNRIFDITNIKLSSSYCDLDQVSQTFAKIHQEVRTQKSNKSNGYIVPIKIEKGVARVDKLKMGDVIATNLSGQIKLNKNILTINNIKAKSCNGSLEGTMQHNLSNQNITLDLYGRGMNANSALSSYLLVKDQIFGNLDFHSVVNIQGINNQNRIKTLNGYSDFSVSNGHMGSIGQLTTYLRAKNVLSQGIINSQIDAIMDSASKAKTEELSYLKGKVHYGNGQASIDYIDEAGPNMALRIKGLYNLVTNATNITIFGKLPIQVANTLGPLYELSTEKMVNNTAMYGQNSLALFKNFTELGSNEELAKIPQLTTNEMTTKDFKVLINGNIQSPNAIKSFKWLNSSNDIQKVQVGILDTLKKETENSNENSVKQIGPELKVPKTKDEILQQFEQNNKNDKPQKPQQISFI